MTYDELQKLVETDQKEAFKVLGFALNHNPRDPALVALYARLMQQMDCYGIAYHLWGAFLGLPHPSESHAYGLNNKSLACVSVGSKEMLAEAGQCMGKALEASPDNLVTLGNLAFYELHNGSYDECLRLCEKALALDPFQKHVYECRAYARLMVGEWAEGWKDWDHSLGTKFRPDVGEEPYWNGESGSLHIRGEQGIGDELSFASILPDVKGCKISLECDKRLEGLFKRSFPNIKVHGTRYGGSRSWYKKHDYRCLIGSLAKHYRKRAEDFPGNAYLTADPLRRVQWQALLDTLPGKKVGIAWTGGAPHSLSELRSFHLKDWQQILDVPGCTFVSLQYQEPDVSGTNVLHFPWGTQTQDYDDTAALVAELDLVISATTAVIHLAGALGKECWVLAPRRSRWFYAREGRRIPWYKSIEIFRQTNEWPIAEVAQRLKQWIPT